MYKKGLVIAVLFISVWGLVGSEAMALCRTIGGVTKCFSIFCAFEFMKAVKIDSTAGCIAVSFNEMDALCQNNGGNADTAQGAVFFPDVQTSGAEIANAEWIGDSGQFTFDQCYDLDAILFDAGYSNPADPNFICANSNWSVIPGSIRVRKATVLFAGYQILGTADELTYASGMCKSFIGVPDDTTSCGYTYIEDPDTVPDCVGSGLRSSCDEAIAALH